MKRLILEDKSGFLADSAFSIYDLKGNEFYTSDFTNKIKNGETLRFNLPAGEYEFTGRFYKLPEAIKQRQIKLPPRERYIKQKRYKIIFGENPNKCTIYYKLGFILFDNSFKEAPLYTKFDIYFHELGHHFYKTEKYADLYAAKKMLDYGFNISQIGRVSVFALSEMSFERKEYIINKLTK